MKEKPTKELEALRRRIEASPKEGGESLRTDLSRYCPSCRLSSA